ncbi:MAG: thiol protease/hemagglutinin PrtT [Fibrobacter sp.]|jgi:hypothetical protein|nr:thiol protease/hemagglutinin PrtT [Fibrobacter sp.]
MNRIFSLLFISLVTFAVAAPVDLSRAERIASGVFETKKNVTLKRQKNRDIQPLSSGMNRSAENPHVLYYVFEIHESGPHVPDSLPDNNRNGFVIISGDDVFTPLLGVSEGGKFEDDNLPENFAWYLQDLERQMEFAHQNGQTATPEIEEAWALAEINSHEPGSYLIQTYWDQWTPYNYLTPVIGSDSTYTGCVATTMSQLMYYHQYPQEISVPIPAYVTRNSKISVPSANTGRFVYDWASMQKSYGFYPDSLGNYIDQEGTRYSKQEYTDSEARAVAALMYHTGASVEMDYGTGSSGAYSLDVPQAMPRYFDYDESVRFISKDGLYIRPSDYLEIGSGTWAPSNDSILPYIWEDILRMQIDSLLPVFYAGNSQDGSSGHAFVLDGYNTNGKFHFNWGWSGSYNGWFVLSALSPLPGYEFNYGHEAVINVMPNLNGNGKADLRVFGKNFTVKDSLALGESFTVNATIYNVGTATLPRGDSLGIAMFNESGNDFEIIGTVELDSVMPFSRARLKTDNSASQLRNDFILEVKAAVSPAAVPGIYLLKPVIKNGSGGWEVVQAATTYSNTASVRVGEEFAPDQSSLELCSITELAPADYDSSYGAMIVKGDSLVMVFGVRNKGAGTFAGNLLVQLTNASGSVTEILGEKDNITIPVGTDCHAFELETAGVTSGYGEYTLSIVSENLAGEKAEAEPYLYGSVVLDKNELSVYVWDGVCRLDDEICRANISRPLIASNNGVTPVRNGFYLTAENRAAVEIFNLKGILIGKQSYEHGSHSVSLGHLPKGMYMVKVLFGRERKALRILVN